MKKTLHTVADTQWYTMLLIKATDLGLSLNLGEIVTSISFKLGKIVSVNDFSSNSGYLSFSPETFFISDLICIANLPVSRDYLLVAWKLDWVIWMPSFYEWWQLQLLVPATSGALISCFKCCWIQFTRRVLFDLVPPLFRHASSNSFFVHILLSSFNMLFRI